MIKAIRVSILFGVLVLWAFFAESYAAEDSCSEGGCSQTAAQGPVQQSEEIEVLSYEDFFNLKYSDEKFVLVDVRSKESFLEGHIEGAVSFPLQEMFPEVVAARFSKNDKIVVYCGSASCPASAGAALKLKALGYDVLDYKGGVKEWMEKGNPLVKE